MRARQLKVVFFDAAGTLFHLRGSVGFHYADVAQRFGCTLSEEKLNAAFRRAWKVMVALRRGEVARTPNDRAWWRALVERVLDDCGDCAAGLNREAYFEQLYGHFTEPGVWQLYPEVEGVLAQLRGQVRLGVISNFDTRLHRILEQLGIARWFDEVVLSSEVGADKPHVRIFTAALERIGAAAGEALHVGDDPDADWRGATEAGLQVFRLERPRVSLTGLLNRCR